MLHAILARVEPEPELHVVRHLLHQVRGVLQIFRTCLAGWRSWYAITESADTRLSIPALCVCVCVHVFSFSLCLFFPVFGACARTRARVCVCARACVCVCVLCVCVCVHAFRCTSFEWSSVCELPVPTDSASRIGL